MTTKDYRVIAQAIANTRETFRLEQSEAIEALERVSLYIADAMENDNRLFDREKFLVATVPKSVVGWREYETYLDSGEKDKQTLDE